MVSRVLRTSSGVVSGLVGPQRCGEEALGGVGVCRLRGQVAEVTKVMQSNLGKVLARGDRLEDLQEASERLNLASADFHVASVRVRRRAWMQHLKMRAILVGVIALVLIGITVPIVVHFTSEPSKPSEPPKQPSQPSS